MHIQIFILLAASSYLIAAGPVRRREAFGHDHLYHRNYNASAIYTTSEEPQTSISVQTPPTSLVSTNTAMGASLVSIIPSSVPVDTSNTPYSTSQTGLASVVSDIAATIATQISSTSSIAKTLSASSTSSPVSVSEIVASTANTLAVGKEEDKQAAFTGIASNLADTATNTFSEGSSSTSVATPTSMAATTTSSTDAAVQIPSSNTYMFAPVTPISSASNVAKPTYSYPSAQNGNYAMASGFNQVYKTLSETSKCDATNQDQEFACISGELAQCQADGMYVLKSCPNGQSCYALPKTSGQTGVSVECAVPSDAAARLAAQPTSVPATINAVTALSATPVSSASVGVSITQAASAVTAPAANKAEDTNNLSGSNDSVQTNSAQTISASSNTLVSAMSAAVSENLSRASNGKIVATSLQISQTVSSVITSVTQAAQNGSNQGRLTKFPETESIQIPVESSVAISQPDSSSHAQPETSATSTVISATQTAQAEDDHPQDQSHPSKASSKVAAMSTGGSGPLFSIVEAASSSPPKQQDHQTQSTASSSPPPATSAPTPGPSLLAEQKPAPSPQSSAAPAPAPHFIQTAEKPQQTQTVDKPTAASSADSAGITFQPLGGNMGVNNNQGASQVANGFANEKVAVPNNISNGPIYITVTTTVTTTAYTQGP